VELVEQRRVARSQVDVLSDAEEVRRVVTRIGVVLGEVRGELRAARKITGVTPELPRWALAKICARTEEGNHLSLGQPPDDDLAVTA
jgi:hypothetical protein